MYIYIYFSYRRALLAKDVSMYAAACLIDALLNASIWQRAHRNHTRHFDVVLCSDTRPSSKKSSIHLFSIAAPPALGIAGVCWRLSQLGEGGIAAFRLPVCQRATQKDKQPFALSLTPTANLDLPIRLTCTMSLDRGRKPEYPGRTNTATGRTCKLHTACEQSEDYKYVNECKRKGSKCKRSGTWNKVAFESVACAAGGRLCAIRIWSDGSNLTKAQRRRGRV